MHLVFKSACMFRPVEYFVDGNDTIGVHGKYAIAKVLLTGYRGFTHSLMINNKIILSYSTTTSCHIHSKFVFNYHLVSPNRTIIQLTTTRIHLLYHQI
jgi:hypothetical protein